MHYALIVEVLQRVLELPEHARRNVAQTGNPCARESVEERHTIDPLHRDPQRSIKHKLLIDPNDVGVRQLRKDAILPVEIARSPNVADNRLKHDGGTFRPRLAPVDATKAPLPKQAKDLVFVVSEALHPALLIRLTLGIRRCRRRSPACSC